MRFGPPVGFARRPDGRKLAYQVLGDGDLDLVFLPGYATHLGGRLALLFAATYPERTKAVVTFASHPASMRDEEFPWGSSEEDREQLLASLRDGSYDPTRLLARMAPREVTDPAFLQWWQMFNLSAMTAPEAYD